MAINCREAARDDAETLWRFLAIAAHEDNVEAARGVPVVAAHLHGWPRPGDFGAIAERDGQALGAAWARQFEPHENPTFHAGPRTPEISIGVSAAERGQGIGLALLQRLAEMAQRRGLDGLCLNVRDSNPALRLYERAGYRRVQGWQAPNRVGGFSIGMILDFARPPG